MKKIDPNARKASQVILISFRSKMCEVAFGPGDMVPMSYLYNTNIRGTILCRFTLRV